MEIQNVYNITKPEIVGAQIKENKALFGPNEITAKIVSELPRRSAHEGNTGQSAKDPKIEARKPPISQYWRYRHDRN